MAPRRLPRPPQPPDVRQFRIVAEIETTITKLKRRIVDIERLRTENIRHDDDRVDNVEHAVRDAIREEFGKDSAEFQRHAWTEGWREGDDARGTISSQACAFDSPRYHAS